MEKMTKVQVLDEAVYISLYANAVWERHENICSPPPSLDIVEKTAVGQTD